MIILLFFYIINKKGGGILEETISYEPVGLIIFFIRSIFINVGSYYIFLKLFNQKNNIKSNLIAIIEILAITYCYALMQEKKEYFNSMILLIIFMAIIFIQASKRSIGTTIIMTLVSLSISFSIFFIAIALNNIPNIVLNTQNDFIIVCCLVITYLIILTIFLKNKRLKGGISFLNNSKNNEQFDLLILNISTIILFLIGIFKNNIQITIIEKMGYSIAILSIIMFATIKKSFQVYYKQKLLMKQLEEADNEIIKKQKEIEKLEQENLNFSKKSHSLAHKQKSLEYKLNQLLMNEEFSGELEIRDRLNEISKELYKNPIEDLPSTEITQIDDMLEFMQSECVKNKIDFNLQIIGNVYHIINNIITVEQLEILIADHIKDAIIAIKHTDNINKSILVKLGKIDGCYGLYIYDSGIEFEKETLKNLGKKPSTTHKDEGGTGMGFMNTFDTLNECKGSLVIKEIGKPSKDNFTKIIMIKFDGKNEYKVESYR